jgi:hypothetical protein
MRLGAGPPGSGHDFNALRKHAFFKGIDWENLHKNPPPVPIERIKELFE